MLTRWRYKRFHPAYCLGVLTTSILLGIILGRYTSVFANSLLIIPAIILVVTCLRSRRVWVFGLLIIAGGLIGAWRGGSFYDSLEPYRQLQEKSVLVKGVVNDDPTLREHDAQQITIGQVALNGEHLGGTVGLTLYRVIELRRGDAITVSGKLGEGFGSQQASLKSTKLVAHQHSSDIINDVRQRFADVTRKLIGEPEASLGLGFVIGQKSFLPEDLSNQLKVAGLTHIVVASGYNLTILVRFARRLLARHSRYLALLVSVILMLGFVAFSGFSPSMNRAALVTVLSLLAWYYGRRFQPVLLLAYVAAISALMNPVYAWADIGWYLSFAAFAGVLILSPLLLARFMNKDKDPSALTQLLLETVAAEVMTLPIIALLFGQIPILSLLANIVVIPMIPLAMVLTAAVGAVGMAVLPLGQVVAPFAQIILHYPVAVVQFVSSMPFAQVTVTLSPWLVLAWYGAIVGLMSWLWYKTKNGWRRFEFS